MRDSPGYAQRIFDRGGQRRRNWDGAALANSFDSQRIKRTWCDYMRLS